MAWMREKREALKLTLKDISEQTGVSIQAISNIENGYRNPSVRLAKKISTVLNVSWTKFFEQGGNSHDNKQC